MQRGGARELALHLLLEADDGAVVHQRATGAEIGADRRVTSKPSLLP